MNHKEAIITKLNKRKQYLLSKIEKELNEINELLSLLETSGINTPDTSNTPKNEVQKNVKVCLHKDTRLSLPSKIQVISLDDSEIPIRDLLSDIKKNGYQIEIYDDSKSDQEKQMIKLVEDFVK